MAKLPAFQFYPGDWIQDTRALTLAAKGAWIDILCALWRSQTRGSLTMPLMGWARLLGCTADQAVAVVTELVGMRICDSNLDESLSRGLLSGDRKAEVRLECRRIIREEKDRQINALCQQRHRSKGKSKAAVREEVRSYSSSSSSFPLISPVGGLRDEDLFEIFWASYPEHRRPKVLVMENVSGLVKGKMRVIFSEILRELKASGYRVSARLMNAMYFGVPQSRERMIFIGVRVDIRECVQHKGHD